MRDGSEYMRVLRWQDDVDLSLGDETTMLIPNRSTVLVVNTRVIEVVTGTVTSFGVGVSGDTSRYGSGIGWQWRCFTSRGAVTKPVRKARYIKAFLTTNARRVDA